MNFIYLQILQLILVVAYTTSESCDMYGELREVKEGRKNSPQVCDYDNSGLLNWFHICNNGWDIADADVWCKQQGYIEAENKGKGFKKPGKDQNTLKMSNFNCNSDTDKKLVDCPNVKQTNKCDYVADIRCKRCDSDMQCSDVGYCDVGSGICKCSSNSTCGVGMMCNKERCECIHLSCQPCQQECQNGGICLSNGTCECVGLYYGDSCQYKSCSNECPVNRFCITVGECVITEIPTTEPNTPPVELPITTIPTELPTTTLSTEAAITTFPIVQPTTGPVTTKLLEITNSDHSTTKPTKLVTYTSEQYSRSGLTLMQKLILSISISAGLACMVIACIVVLSICFINNIRKKRKRVLIKENEYEEMAPLPSCNFHEYNNCSENISPSSPIEYDSVTEEIISYSTVESVSDSVVTAEQAPYYSTVRENISVNGVAIEVPYYSTVGEIIPAISIEEPAPYYSTVGEIIPAISIEEPAPYYSTVGEIIPAISIEEPVPYYSTVGEIIPAISIEEPAPYYSTVGENIPDSETINTNEQAPYYSTIGETLSVSIEEPAPYYSTVGDTSAGNEPNMYESIEFGYRDYENINENNPIEPYLIT